jgi:hypothetical protein
MMEAADDNDYLRDIKLEVVAGYLKCDPELLRRTLKRLSEISAAIEYGPGQAAAITKAVPITEADLADYLLGSGDEVTELEALYDRQDTR